VALISKSVVPEVKKVLDETTKMFNYIKGRPLQSQMSALRSATEAAHTQLIRRFCELREEFINVFASEEAELADLLSDETWCNKVAFLADISQASNTLNKSMQGEKNENVLICILLRKE
jgi:hypothetical protein